MTSSFLLASTSSFATLELYKTFHLPKTLPFSLPCPVCSHVLLLVSSPGMFSPLAVSPCRGSFASRVFLPQRHEDIFGLAQVSLHAPAEKPLSSEVQLRSRVLFLMPRYSVLKRGYRVQKSEFEAQKLSFGAGVSHGDVGRTQSEELRIERISRRRGRRCQVLSIPTISLLWVSGLDVKR
jgi:hypothetical protein